MAHPIEDPAEPPRSPKRVKRPIVSNPRIPMGSNGHEGNTAPTSSPTKAIAATAPPISPLPIIELLDWQSDRVPNFKINEPIENVNRVIAAVLHGLRPKTYAELASERNPLPNPQQPVEGPRTDARVPKPKVHDLYTFKPVPVDDDEMEDVGFQAAGDGPEQPNNLNSDLLGSADEQIHALVEKRVAAIIEEQVDAVAQWRVGGLIEKYNDVLALKVNEIIANLNGSSDKLYQAMTEQRDGLCQEITQERDELFQWTKEQRDELLHAMTELKDEKNKGWSEGFKRESLAGELHDRRKGLAKKDHESRQDGSRLNFDTRLEDATRHIREVALEERKLQQQDFDAKAQQMQKDFDEMAKRAQIGADWHTTQQVERVIREIQVEALRTQQAQNVEYDRRRKQQVRRKLDALDAEDALQRKHVIAVEARRINSYEAQRKALEEELAE